MERSLDCYEQYYGRNRLFINSVKKNETEDTDEVVAEIFENKMQKKVSVNDIDTFHRLGKNIPEVDFDLLPSNLPGTMSVMQFLEER